MGLDFAFLCFATNPRDGNSRTTPNCYTKNNIIFIAMKNNFLEIGRDHLEVLSLIRTWDCGEKWFSSNANEWQKYIVVKIAS